MLVGLNYFQNLKYRMSNTPWRKITNLKDLQSITRVYMGDRDKPYIVVGKPRPKRPIIKYEEGTKEEYEKYFIQLAYDGYRDAVRTYDLDVFTNG